MHPFKTMAVLVCVSSVPASAGWALAEQHQVTVAGQANIFGAGHAVAPGPYGGGGGLVPPVVALPPDANLVVRMTSVAGTVCCVANSICNSNPDGVPQGAFGRTDITSYGGISGIVHGQSTMFLVGVFLSDQEPADPAPARLTFNTGGLTATFLELSPALNQSFFIGDGRSTGDQQIFRVPAGATRLFLGFADSKEFGEPSTPPGYYGDNSGLLQVELTVNSDSPVPARRISLGQLKAAYW